MHCRHKTIFSRKSKSMLHTKIQQIQRVAGLLLSNIDDPYKIHNVNIAQSSAIRAWMRFNRNHPVNIRSTHKPNPKTSATRSSSAQIPLWLRLGDNASVPACASPESAAASGATFSSTSPSAAALARSCPLEQALRGAARSSSIADGSPFDRPLLARGWRM